MSGRWVGWIAGLFEITTNSAQVEARARAELGNNIGDSEFSPPSYDTAISLMDEINEVAFTPGDKLKGSNDDDYVDQHQVANKIGI